MLGGGAGAPESASRSRYAAPSLVSDADGFGAATGVPAKLPPPVLNWRW